MLSKLLVYVWFIVFLYVYKLVSILILLHPIIIFCFHIFNLQKLDFQAVPFWEEEGLSLVQSYAIARHLARRYGNFGFPFPAEYWFLLRIQWWQRSRSSKDWFSCGRDQRSCNVFPQTYSFSCWSKGFNPFFLPLSLFLALSANSRYRQKHSKNSWQWMFPSGSASLKPYWRKMGQGTS